MYLYELDSSERLSFVPVFCLLLCNQLMEILRDMMSRQKHWVNWVPEQLIIKAVTGASEFIDGCSLKLCLATPSVATSGICHRNKVNSNALPWDSISYIYIYIYILSQMMVGVIKIMPRLKGFLCQMEHCAYSLIELLICHSYNESRQIHFTSFGYWIPNHGAHNRNWSMVGFIIQPIKLAGW